MSLEPRRGRHERSQERRETSGRFQFSRQNLIWNLESVVAVYCATDTRLSSLCLAQECRSFVAARHFAATIGFDLRSLTVQLLVASHCHRSRPGPTSVMIATFILVSYSVLNIIDCSRAEQNRNYGEEELARAIISILSVRVIRVTLVNPVLHER